jgi:hypothetical protein
MTKLEDILYRSGDVFLPKSVRDVLERYYIGNDTSLFYFTNWSLVHFFSGMGVAYFTESYLNGFLLHTIWEFWQIIIRNTPLTLRGLIDIVVDTVMFMMGMVLFTGIKHV